MLVPSSERNHSGYVPAAAILKHDVIGFDATFFGFTPYEARLMDPQQRLFLEIAWVALEDQSAAAQGRHRHLALYPLAKRKTMRTRSRRLNHVPSPGFRCAWQVHEYNVQLKPFCAQGFDLWLHRY